MSTEQWLEVAAERQAQDERRLERRQQRKAQRVARKVIKHLDKGQLDFRYPRVLVNTGLSERVLDLVNSKLPPEVTVSQHQIYMGSGDNANRLSITVAEPDVGRPATTAQVIPLQPRIEAPTTTAPEL